MNPPAHHQFSILHSRGGQLMVEVVVASSVLVIGFLGILALLSRSLGLSRVVADNYTATYLAAEGIEVVKNLLDHNVLARQPWTSGFSDGIFEVDYGSMGLAGDDRFLRFNPITKRYGYESLSAQSLPTNFKRKIRISRISRDGVIREVAVSSTVSWAGRGGNFQVDLEDHFFNWRP